MALHLLRMAVKIESIAHLKQVQAERLREEQRNGGEFLYTFTRNIPKRVDELLMAVRSLGDQTVYQSTPTNLGA